MPWPTHALTPSERGYDAAHRAQRARIVEHMASGASYACSRCGQPIQHGQAWHLDHDDVDRTKYLGPAHATCNERAGKHKAERVLAEQRAKAHHPRRRAPGLIEPN